MKVFNIVYDVDDVLNNLNDYVISKVGCQPSKYYNVHENDGYTEQEKERILEMFADPQTFKNLSLVDGAKEICDIEDTGKALVWISSRNFNEDVADVKYDTLVDGIPNLCEDRIDLQIGLGEHKIKTHFADIVVEDCFVNLLKYPESVYKILIDKSYNQAENYGTTDKAENIIRVKNLREANDLIQAIVF